MAHYDLTMPISEEQARKLRFDDSVTLNGTLFGLRDATLIHMLDRGRKTRFDLSGHAAIHTTPNVRKLQRSSTHPTGYPPLSIPPPTPHPADRLTPPLLQHN